MIHAMFGKGEIDRLPFLKGALTFRTDSVGSFCTMTLRGSSLRRVSGPSSFMTRNSLEPRALAVSCRLVGMELRIYASDALFFIVWV